MNDSENYVDLGSALTTETVVPIKSEAQFVAFRGELQAHFKENPVNNPSRGSVGSNHEDRTYPQLAEAALLQELLKKALEDYQGTDAHALDACIECHEDADCLCIKPWVEGADNRERRRNLRLGFAFSWRDCANSHTNQECARHWFGASSEAPWSFVWVCRHLDLDECYFRMRFAIPSESRVVA